MISRLELYRITGMKNILLPYTQKVGKDGFGYYRTADEHDFKIVSARKCRRMIKEQGNMCKVLRPDMKIVKLGKTVLYLTDNSDNYYRYKSGKLEKLDEDRFNKLVAGMDRTARYRAKKQSKD